MLDVLNAIWVSAGSLQGGESGYEFDAQGTRIATIQQVALPSGSTYINDSPLPRAVWLNLILVLVSS